MALTPLLIPVVKGIAGALGTIGLLGGGGFYAYKRYKATYPLTEYLESVTASGDKKIFTASTLVSHTKIADGVEQYKYDIPNGYSVKDMMDLKPAIEDKFDCEIQVWAEETNFVIEVMTNPIPKAIDFDSEQVRSVLSNYDCAMYLGQSRKGDMVMDFTENSTPHLLFGAPTGGGKSNLLNQGICGMIETYTPEQLNLYLIDMKDGVEFTPYENVKHVKGFYETFSQVDEGLSQILLELKRRNGLFKKSGVKKLSEYNEICPPLPRIVIIADEFAQFNNIGDRELKKSIYAKWEEILQKGRSTGIHVVVGTQVADADVFPKQIKGNIDARFGFKFKDPQHSKMVSGGSELTLLPNIMGRGMFILGSLCIQTQTPYISKKMFKEVISRHQLERPREVVKIEKTVAPPKAEKRVETVQEIKEPIPTNADISNLFLTEEEWQNEKPATI